eukprot:COSAG06_NODE_51811_length_309_cov_1.900000_1_plen_29_part_01
MVRLTWFVWNKLRRARRHVENVIYPAAIA